MAKLVGICDTRCQLFQNEVMGKENSLRIKWFVKNREKLIEQLGSEQLRSEAKEIISTCEERQSQRPKLIIKDRTPLPLWRPPAVMNESINLNAMKPVEPEIKNTLYEKGVQTFVAANNYLSARLKKKPEDRFYFPDCSNWIYGWRLKDYPSIPASKIGLKSVIQTEFYHRVSDFERNPDWHRDC